jgi:hypothetical protein
MTEDERLRWIVDRIASTGPLTPKNVSIGRHDVSIAVAFDINAVVETIEGCGGTDAEKADDVLRQLRQRLRQGPGMRPDQPRS